MLERINTSLQDDSRIVAAWLSGSRGRGTADNLSDIDIWLAVEDHAIGQIVENPLAFVHAIAPTIMHIQAPSIAPPGGVYLLTWIPVEEGFGQVDWYWTPEATASRPAQTRLLFERRPVSVRSPKLDRLDNATLVADIDGTIRDALLMIANAWKHARRGDAWRTVGHLQHVDAALARLDWLVTHDRIPAFEDPTRSFLPHTVPVGQDDQRTALRQALATLQTLIDHAGRRAPFAEAMRALSATLDS